jgi:hypothetical protein
MNNSFTDRIDNDDIDIVQHSLAHSSRSVKDQFPKNMRFFNMDGRKYEFDPDDDIFYLRKKVYVYSKGKLN